MNFEFVVRQERERLERLHPTPDDIPTCFKLLDDFLNCNVVGAQFRSLYRHGHTATCSPKFDELKFCFSIKSYSPDERREAWINRRAEWWARRRVVERSSEDVWQMRVERLQDWPRPITFDPNSSTTSKDNYIIE